MDSLGDSIYSATTISTVTGNESVAIVSGVGELANDDVTVITFFGGANVSTQSTGITVGTQVNVTKATGVLAVDSINFSNGNWNATYEYEGAEYVTNSTSRSLLPLVLIFFALAIVLIGYVIVVKGFKEFF